MGAQDVSLRNRLFNVISYASNYTGKPGSTANDRILDAVIAWIEEASAREVDRVKAMLLRAGYVERPGEYGGARVFRDIEDQEPLEPGDGLGAREFAHHVPAAAGHPYPQSIELGQGDEGYAGFTVSLFFDEEGRFVGHASWE